MKLQVNSKVHSVQENSSLKSLVQYTNYRKSEALLYIQNAFVVTSESIAKTNDEIYIIPKDMCVSKDDMASFLSARHSNGVIEKMQIKKVAILGLGGLGSNTAMNLARSGVSNIKIIDFDTVDPSNLNRQNYYIDQIGMKKTRASLENLMRINPYLNIEIVDDYLSRDNFDSHLIDADIIVEAFDNPKSKADLARHFLEDSNGIYLDKYLITSSGMAGFYSSNIVKTKRLKDRLYICGDLKNSAKEFEGLMAARVNIVAGHQANCVIRILMGNMEV